MRSVAVIVAFAIANFAVADAWRMGGRTPSRNPVVPGKNPITDWQFPTDELAVRNILWSVRVGSRAIGGPAVSGGLVWIGTNNREPLDPKLEGDFGILACFRASDG